MDGIGSVSGIHLLALGSLPLDMAARCHSVTETNSLFSLGLGDGDLLVEVVDASLEGVLTVRLIGNWRCATRMGDIM